jgi:hypothetical protein
MFDISLVKLVILGNVAIRPEFDSTHTYKEITHVSFETITATNDVTETISKGFSFVSSALMWSLLISNHINAVGSARGAWSAF